MNEFINKNITELVTAFLAVIGPVITWFVTKKEERKKARKEIESLRVANDSLEEDYRGKMLSTNEKLFESISNLQERLHNTTIEQTKLKARQILLEQNIENLEKLNIELQESNRKFKIELAKHEKLIRELTDTNKKLYAENKELKEKLKTNK